MKKATVYSYSIIHTAAEAFKDKVPFVVALVDDGEARFLTQVEGYQEGREITIGMEVTFSHQDEEGKTIYKF